MPVLVSAQPADRVLPSENARILTENMKTLLKLTEEQIPKVMKLSLEFFTKIEQIQKAKIDAGDEKYDFKKEMKMNRSENIKKLKLILTGEQWVQFKENKKEFQDLFKKK